MSSTGKEIPLLEFKRLLHELNDRQSYTCIRIRMMGQLWNQSFMKITTINDAGLTLYNETDGRFLQIPNLHNIMQFELDHAFQGYQPHFHYDVKLTE